jgi:hypothetical protein
MFHTSPKLTSGLPRITSPGRAFYVKLTPNRPTSGLLVTRVQSSSRSPFGPCTHRCVRLDRDSGRATSPTARRK